MAPLLALLTGRDEHLQELAGGVLRNLSLSHAQSIVNEGGVAPLVALMRTFDERAQEHAVVCLRNVTAGAGETTVDAKDGGDMGALASADAEVVRQGGLPPLVALLRSSAPSIQEHAAGTLRNLSESGQYAKEIVEEGALGPLIHLLQVCVCPFSLCPFLVFPRFWSSFLFIFLIFSVSSVFWAHLTREGCRASGTRASGGSPSEPFVEWRPR